MRQRVENWRKNETLKIILMEIFTYILLILNEIYLIKGDTVEILIKIKSKTSIINFKEFNGKL